jgi:hypothetical protein
VHWLAGSQCIVTSAPTCSSSSASRSVCGGGISGTNCVIAALEPYRGTLYHTTLDPTVEAEIRDALK